jgi:hypothetical protein
MVNNNKFVGIGWRGTREILMNYPRRRSMEDVAYIALDKFTRRPSFLRAKGIWGSCFIFVVDLF